MQKNWWKEKVAYQIYPKSFYDTDGNGVGDLRGIIDKLDYLKELGVDIIWISPCYCSPFADQGYDISDYYNIDPVFGDMADMEELLVEAKKRDMYILMDLVVNHCSDEHEWFQKALADPTGKYGKYFYIEECPDGKLPCNWRSYFGGPVWERIPGTDYYYFHAFHKKQPDLNWENPQVRREIYKMMNWWLDKGLAGFRIDAIINIKKVLPFKDYPADRADGLCSIQHMLEEAEGVQDFLQEMADQTFRPHAAFTVGEVFDAKEEELPEFIGEHGCFSSMFDFDPTIYDATECGWYARKGITPEEFKECCFASQAKYSKYGFLSNIIENHDEPRGVSRYIPEGECDERSKKLLATVSLILRGLPFIYQGQEIGMENLEFQSIDEINDINTLDEYQVALDAGLSPEDALHSVNRFSRDNARTPVQWDDSPNAGFTQGTPWLRVNPNYKTINVAEQLQREDSLWHHYRKLIALRKDPSYAETIVYGDLKPIWEEKKNLMAFYRKSKEQTLLVVANYQKEPQSVTLEQVYKKVVLNNYVNLNTKDSELCLEGYQAVILEM
ncbi:MAG: alpha-glucosidase [Lachnospiraceae bacterium]|nr:alpha-glucosidase [Lachnospiraceae bacterium]